MRAALMLLFVIACKTDADADGVSSNEDCDDANAGAYPGATESCDGVDNDCDDEIDEDAADAGSFYADADGDGHGDEAGSPVVACAAPDGLVSVADDCDDTDAATFTGNVEVCDGVDNDCDGDIDDDATDMLSLFLDSDGDGYGDPGAPVAACAEAEGLVADDNDCDDGDANSYPNNVEICDGRDNDCWGGSDNGIDGTDPDCPADNCDALVGTGWPSGLTYIDPAGSGLGTLAYCDMTTDYGGWTLLSWNGSSSVGTGVPYPGLYVCPTLDCLRGSAAGPEVLQALIQGARSVGVGHSTAGIASFQELGSYSYAGLYDYGSLAGFQTAVADETQSCAELASGPYYALVGDSTYDGTTMYVAEGFVYAAGYYNYSEGGEYIWNIGAPNSACEGSGSAPGSWIGDWPQAEFGPIGGSTLGARSVWVR